MSTIAAISSPIGAGGIGIVRVSGNEALRIADAIFIFAHNKASADASFVMPEGVKQQWTPLFMNYGTFDAGEFCDKGYAVYFPAKRAYTGEDTVEFYLHGGVRIMQGALDALLRNGAVMAKNGEFTKRAFLNGRLSLADAEGVIDMINAESAAGVKAAYRLMQGEVSKKIDSTLDTLETLISTLEATLDYPDEMEDEVLPDLEKSVRGIHDDVCALIATAKTGKIAKYGINVVLAGNTNAGKSSLMNALLKDDRAIVTDIAGTTRDTVEESFECDGVRINLIDTAGIRESDDLVESKGIERANARLKARTSSCTLWTRWVLTTKIGSSEMRSCLKCSTSATSRALTNRLPTTNLQSVQRRAKVLTSLLTQLPICTSKTRWKAANLSRPNGTYPHFIKQKARLKVRLRQLTTQSTARS